MSTRICTWCLATGFHEDLYTITINGTEYQTCTDCFTSYYDVLTEFENLIKDAPQLARLAFDKCSNMIINQFGTNPSESEVASMYESWRENGYS